MKRSQRVLLEHKLFGLTPFCWFPKLMANWHFVSVISSISERYYCSWQIFTVYWFLNKGTTSIPCSPNYRLHFLSLMRSDNLSPLEMFGRKMCLNPRNFYERERTMGFHRLKYLAYNSEKSQFA